MTLNYVATVLVFWMCFASVAFGKNGVVEAARFGRAKRAMESALQISKGRDLLEIHRGRVAGGVVALPKMARKLISDSAVLPEVQPQCTWDSFTSSCAIGTSQFANLLEANALNSSLAVALIDELVCETYQYKVDCIADSRCTFVGNSYCASLALPQAYSTCYTGDISNSLYCGGFGNRTLCNLDTRCSWNSGTCGSADNNSTIPTPSANATADYLAFLTSSYNGSQLLPCPSSIPSSLCDLYAEVPTLLPNATACTSLTIRECIFTDASCQIVGSIGNSSCALDPELSQFDVEDTLLPLLSTYQDPTLANLTTQTFKCTYATDEDTCLASGSCIWNGILSSFSSCDIDKNVLLDGLYLAARVNNFTANPICNYFEDSSNCQEANTVKDCTAMPYCDYSLNPEFVCYVSNQDGVDKSFGDASSSPAAMAISKVIESCKSATSKTKCQKL